MRTDQNSSVPSRRSAASPLCADPRSSVDSRLHPESQRDAGLPGPGLTGSKKAASPTRRLLLAASLANLPFGTIYAFSVLLKPIESLLGLQRTDLTLVFALATIVLTVGMNLAPVLYRRIPVHMLLGGAAALSAAGLLMTAVAQSRSHLLLGYSVLFGLGAGVVFTTVQHMVNQADLTRRGLVNGYVVSLYPLGAMLGAPLMGWSIGEIGLRATLLALAGTLGASLLGAAWLLRTSHAATHARQGMQDAIEAGTRPHDRVMPGQGGTSARTVASPSPARGGLFLCLASIFTLAASAGLMVMSQAAGIMQAYGAGLGAALAATTFMTGAIALARILGGWLVDRFAVHHVMAAAQLWALVGAALLSVWPTATAALPGLTMIGMGYGLISGASAAAIGQWWPMAQFGLIAGRLYIGWCVAAISLPLVAARLYDASGTYNTAILLAGGFNTVAMLVALRLGRVADAAPGQPKTPRA